MKIKLTLLALFLASATAFAGNRMDVVKARCKTMGEANALMLQQINKPYAAEAAGEDSFDNLGLAIFMYKLLGLDIPTDVVQLSKVGKSITKIAKLLPGDIVFFANPQNKKEIVRMGVVQSISIDGLSFTIYFADEKQGIVRIAHSSEDMFNGHFMKATRITNDSELNSIRAEQKKDADNVEKAKASLIKAQAALSEAEENLSAMEKLFEKKNEDPIIIK